MASRARIWTATFVVVGAVTICAVGCAEDGRSRDAVVDRAVDAGLSEELAVCLVDGLYEELGSERLEELMVDPATVEDLHQDEVALFDAVSADCLAGGEPVEGPDVSIVD